MKLIKKITSHALHTIARIVSFPSKLLPSRWIRKMNSDQRRFFNLIVTGTVLVAGTWTVTSLLSPDRSEASWFNDNWQYRQTVPIANTGTEQSEFQVQVEVDTATLIAAGKMQADCDDVRFTGHNGELLSYHQTTACDAAKTRYWVKVNTIPVGDSTIYLYYGNTTAPAGSDRDQTFDINLMGQYVQQLTNASIAQNHGASSDRENNFYISNSTIVNRFNTSWVYQQQYATLDLYTGLCYDDKRDRFYGIDWNSKQWSTFDTSFVEIAPMDQTLGNQPIDCATDSTYIYTNHRTGLIGRNAIADNTSETFNMDTLSGFDWGGQGLTYAYGYLFAGTTSSYGANGNRIYVIDIQDWNNPRIVTYWDASGHILTEVAGLTWKDKYIYQTDRSNDYANEWTGPVKTAAVEPVVSSPTNEESSPGPIAYWSMDEGSGGTVNDATANDNNGTISGATWQEESMCLKGRCLFFDGTNDQVDFGNINNVPLEGDLTISFWMKPTNIAKGRQNPLGKSYGGEFDFTLETTGALTYYHGPTGGNASTWYAHASSALSQDQWTHVTLTRDITTRTIKYYINGRQQSTGTWTSDKDPSLSSRSFKFGYEYVGYYQGYLDEVKIYASARSQEQIKTDYNTGTAAVLGAKNANLNNGLVGYWKMDESSWNGTTGEIIDSSGNGNNGTSATTTSGTSSGTNTSTTLNDTSKAWTINQFTNHHITINGGTGSGQTRTISSNTATEVTVSSAWTTTPDATSTYRINSTASTGKFGNALQAHNNGTGLVTTKTISWDEDNFTLSTWIKSADTDGTQSRIMGVSFTSGGYYWVNFGNGLVRIECRDSDNVGCGQNGGSTNTNPATTNIADNTWHHVTLVNDRENNKIYTFVDGKLESTTDTVFTGTFGLSSDTHLFRIGYQSTAATISLDGQFDETRVYKRALSPTEVQQLYNYAPPPVAYYDFEEGSGSTVSDKSGNENGGTWSGTGSHWATGKYGKSGNFNGTDDYINIGNNASTTLNGHLTLAAWINPTDESTSRVIMRKDSNYILYYFGGNLDFYIYGPDARLSYPLSNLDTNRWYYIAATYDGQYMRIFVDGVEVAKAIQSTALTSSSSSLRIGSTSTGAMLWNGLIDEARIYNYARTPGQIIEDMNAGHPIGGSPVGSQIGYWKFDEGSGTTANNSGNSPSLIGTLNGATWSNNGKYGKALSFNGSSNVTLSNISPLQTDTKTVSFWANPTSAPTSFQGILYGGLNWYVGVNSNNRVMASYAKSDGTQTTVYSSNNTLIPNEWHYYAVTMYVSGSNVTATFYRDGKIVNTVNHSTGYGTSYASSFTIGGVGSTYYFSGLLDEIKFYNTALTEEQITIDYNAGQSLQFGVLGTEADGTPSNSSDRAYCPPGDTTASCGPVGEWKFDDRYGTTPKDTSGSGYNGTFVGTPTWIQGKIGSALNFNGTNQYVTMGDNLDLIGSPLTLSVWVNPRTWASLGGIVTKLSSGGNYRLIMQSNGTVAFGIRAADNTYQQVASTTSLPLNQWSHIAVAYDNSSTARIYINGKLDATGTTLTLTRGDATTSLVIGYNANNAAYFDGAIDHVQLYNYVRSEAQVAWDYSRGAPIAHYKLNECQGGTVHSSTLPYNSVLDGTINIGSSGTQTSAGTCQTAGSAWGNGASGKFNGSLNFDGTDDYVSIPDSNLLDMDYQTLTAWVKTNGNGADQYISERNNTVFYIRISSSGTLCYYLATVGATWTCTTRTVNDGNWHHVATSWNGTTKKLYIDGILAGSESYAGGTLNASANAINIGVRINGGTPAGYFNGQIDDIQIFNYALTPQQIKTIMTQGAIRFGN